MINDLKAAPSKKRALGPNKTSPKLSLSTFTENPLDQTSIILDYPSDNLQLFPSRNDDTQNSNGIISPPHFYTKHPTRKLPEMSKLKFLPKRKSYKTITVDYSKPITQSMSHPSLPHYTNVTSKSDTYPLNSTPHYITETETPVKTFYSKTNYSFPPIFLTSVIQYFSSSNTS